MYEWVTIGLKHFIHYKKKIGSYLSSYITKVWW